MGHPVTPVQKADTTGQCDSADAHGRGVAETRGQTVLRGRGRVVASRQARARPCRPLRRVDVERPHAGQIEDDAVVACPVARKAVSAAAHRERLARDIDTCATSAASAARTTTAGLRSMPVR